MCYYGVFHDPVNVLVDSEYDGTAQPAVVPRVHLLVPRGAWIKCNMTYFCSWRCFTSHPAHTISSWVYSSITSHMLTHVTLTNCMTTEKVNNHPKLEQSYQSLNEWDFISNVSNRINETLKWEVKTIQEQKTAFHKKCNVCTTVFKKL